MRYSHTLPSSHLFLQRTRRRNDYDFNPLCHTCISQFTAKRAALHVHLQHHLRVDTARGIHPPSSFNAICNRLPSQHHTKKLALLLFFPHWLSHKRHSPDMHARRIKHTTHAPRQPTTCATTKKRGAKRGQRGAKRALFISKSKMAARLLRPVLGEGGSAVDRGSVHVCVRSVVEGVMGRERCC